MTDPTIKQTLVLMTLTVGLALAGWMLAFVFVAFFSGIKGRYILFAKMSDSTSWVIGVCLVLLFAAYLWAGVYDLIQLIKGMT